MLRNFAFLFFTSDGVQVHRPNPQLEDQEIFCRGFCPLNWSSFGTIGANFPLSSGSFILSARSSARDILPLRLLAVFTCYPRQGPSQGTIIRARPWFFTRLLLLPSFFFIRTWDRHWRSMTGNHLTGRNVGDHRENGSRMSRKQ